MKVKICGITSFEDAEICNELGADILGFVHFPGRPRSLTLDSVAGICDSLAPGSIKALVCAPESVDDAAYLLSRSRADVLQTYTLDPDEIQTLGEIGVKVMRVVLPSREEAMRFRSCADALVYESGVPGSGSSYDYSTAPLGSCSREFIAGGLNRNNISCVKSLGPYGVDVSSGVESHPGRKDPEKVRMFIEGCRD